jgi:hypothetical protein
MSKSLKQIDAKAKQRTDARAAKFATLVPQFKAEICDRSADVDPDSEYDWYAISLGWAIAKGLTPDDAGEFSIHVRYDLHYFHP